MGFNKVKTLVATACLISTASVTSAGVTSPQTGFQPIAPGVDVTLTIQQANGGYDFVFNNNSTLGIVTGIYFETNWDNILSDAKAITGPAIFEAETIRPQSPDINGWSGSDASYTVERKLFGVRVSRRLTFNEFRDNLDHGLEEGQSQTFSYNALSGSTSQQSLEDLVGTDGFNIAIRMQGLTQNEQRSGWGVAEEREEELFTFRSLTLLQQGLGTAAPPVPTPSAGLTCLVVAGIAGLRRRRK